MSTPSGRLMAMGTLFICAPVYEAFDPSRQLRQWEIHLRENNGPSKQKVIALWSGPAAESFMRMHRAACKPGQPLQLTFERIFPLHNELHGIVATASLAPGRWEGRGTSTNHNSEESHAS